MASGWDSQLPVIGQCCHSPFFDSRPMPLVHSASVNHTAPSGPTTRAYGVPPGLGIGSSRKREAYRLGVGVGTITADGEGDGLKIGPGLGEAITTGLGPGPVAGVRLATGKRQLGPPKIPTRRTRISITAAPTTPETILVCMLTGSNERRRQR